MQNQAPKLVIMAAGMGSRFGGLKQITPVGDNGEIIMDFSPYAAYQAGLRKVVLVIQKAPEEDFPPIRGPEGNIEYLAWLKKGAESIPEPDIDALVAASHAAHGKDSE